MSEAWKKRDRPCPPCPHCGAELYEKFWGNGGWVPTDKKTEEVHSARECVEVLGEAERAIEQDRCAALDRVRDEELGRWQARFAEAVIDGDRMRLALHDLAFAAPTVGDEHRNAKGWLSPEAWGAYVSRVQKMAGSAIRRPACVCVACGCPADAHKVDDEERRECEQCDGCTQYEAPR
jgi:hypothetical protein